jgi:copper(I)-binding protein
MNDFGRLALALALALAGLPAFAAAQDYKVGSIKVSQAWSREVPNGSKVAGAYMTLTNTGAEPDTLIGGSASLAGKFEVHEMSMTDGIMRMRRLDPGLVIKPGETVVLRPGSFHIMLMQLSDLPKMGQPIKGTLVFAKAGKVDIEYKVEPFGTRAPGDGGQAMPKPGVQKKSGSGHAHH